MFDRGSGLRLTLEAFEGFGVLHEIRMQGLERDLTLERELLGLVHDSHAAASDLTTNAKAATELDPLG